MKTLILKTVTERLKQLESEYLTSVLLLETYAPDYPIPEYKPDMIKEKTIPLRCGICSRHNKEAVQEEYMTIKEAMAALRVSRNTINRWRKEKILTSFYRKRTVALLTSEVERLTETYSKVRGKI